jgi:hypothetical protein
LASEPVGDAARSSEIRTAKPQSKRVPWRSEISVRPEIGATEVRDQNLRATARARAAELQKSEPARGG